MTKKGYQSVPSIGEIGPDVLVVYFVPCHRCAGRFLPRAGMNFGAKTAPCLKYQRTSAVAYDALYLRLLTSKEA